MNVVLRRTDAIATALEKRSDWLSLFLPAWWKKCGYCFRKGNRRRKGCKWEPQHSPLHQRTITKPDGPVSRIELAMPVRRRCRRSRKRIFLAAINLGLRRDLLLR